MVEVLVGPGRARCAKFAQRAGAGRILEALVRGDRTAEDAPEVRALQVRAALFEGVALHAFLVLLGAFRNVGARQEQAVVARTRHDCRANRAGLDRHIVASELMLFMVEHGVRGLVQADNGQRGPEDAESNLVEAEITHGLMPLLPGAQKIRFEPALAALSDTLAGVRQSEKARRNDASRQP